MKKSLVPLLQLAAMAAAHADFGPGLPVRHESREKESIDDILARARANRGKGWWKAGGAP